MNCFLITYHTYTLLFLAVAIFEKRKEIRARIFKRLWSPGIDFKEIIPPVYVASGGPVRNPISTRFLAATTECLKIPAQFSSRTSCGSYILAKWQKKEKFCREPVIHEAKIRDGGKTVHIAFRCLYRTACIKGRGGGGRSNVTPHTLLPSWSVDILF